MKRAQGFTLVELVVVMVILGILSTVLAPKLFNIKDGAIKASVLANADSIRTTSDLAYYKSMMVNLDHSPSTAVTTSTGEKISIHFGYPTSEYILSMFDKASGFTKGSSPSAEKLVLYPRSINLPDANDAETGKCYIEYIEATEHKAYSIKTETTNC